MLFRFLICALSLAIAHASSAITPQSFLANVSVVLQVSLGPTVVTATVTGVFAYNHFLQMERVDYTSLVIDTGTGSPTVVTGQYAQILNYQLQKNFTWDVTNPTTSCACTDFNDASLPVVFVPAGTPVSQTNVNVTLPNIFNVSTSLYFVAFSQFISGALASVNYSLYVDSSNHVRQITYPTTVNIGVSIPATVKLWFFNVIDLTSIANSATLYYATAAPWTPPASCYAQCLVPPVFNSGTFAGGVTGCTNNCKAPNMANVAFCTSNVGQYCIPAAINEVDADTTAGSIFAALVTQASVTDANCGAALKTFLCHYYFPQCSSTAVSIPPYPVWTKSGCTASQSTTFGQVQASATYNILPVPKSSATSIVSSLSTIAFTILSILALFKQA